MLSQLTTEGPARPFAVSTGTSVESPRDRRCDWRDGHGGKVWPHKLAREDEDGARLIEVRDVDSTHQSSWEGSPAAYSANPTSSGSSAVRARIAASRSAITRRRSRSSARVTTDARLRSLPEPTISLNELDKFVWETDGNLPAHPIMVASWYQIIWQSGYQVSARWPAFGGLRRLKQRTKRIIPEHGAIAAN